MAVTTGPEAEERETSRAEKLLATGLVIFLLIGGFWVMDRLTSFVERPDWQAIAAAEGLTGTEEALRQVEADYYRADEATREARVAVERARSEYEYRKEEYRVALERGLDDPALAGLHEQARTAYDVARENYALAEATQRSFEARVTAPRAAYAEASRRVDEAYGRAQDRYELLAFLLRFGYALPLFALSVWAWLGLRRRHGRNLIVATAFMAFAGLQAIALVFQYGWYILRDIGPIALSLAGSAVCITGLVALRRWAANPRRLATARLRRGQCPYCGYPLAPGAAHCAGCGRGLVEPCPECGRGSVPESPYCPHCGVQRA
jgi:hypothetical protein